MPIKVFLVVRPQFDLQECLAFLEAEKTTWRRTPTSRDAEEITEVAGRICYMSFGDRQSPRETAEYVRNLIHLGHESVLEHAVWSFIISGISRSLSHQLVRHRVGIAFSQLSQQYHEESEAQFLMPPAIQRNPEAAAAWDMAISLAREAYSRILAALGPSASESPMGKETRRELLSAARSVLPNATRTTIFMSANARALRHLLTVRGSIVGDEEMRTLAAELLVRLRDEAPSLFADFRIDSLADGSPIVVKVSSS